VTAGSDLRRFADVLARRFGWTYAEQDAEHLLTLLAERSALAGMTVPEYLDRLAGRPWTEETTALIERLSITETYFFRHGEQFTALREVALPERIAARSAQRVLRILSVACSSGEEAYSLAILARQAQPDQDWIIRVLGVDANPAMLAAAHAGSYAPWSLRETPEPVRKRWFHGEGDRFRVADEVRAMVDFRRCNVADPDDNLWRPEQYDVIFCRNLLMYLTAEVAAVLIQRMTAALAPGGFLFLGYTDSLGAAPPGLELQHTHRAFYYRRAATQPPAQRPAPEPPPPPAPVDDDAYNRALTLLLDERFAEALRVTGAHPSARSRDRLLHGVLLAQAGRLDEATATARGMIDQNGLDPDAHQLLGICLEGLGDDGAEVQYRLAAHLDPAFALARLRLGQLARRRGADREAARELEHALDLLPRESEARIIQFGGGFGRIALTVLCRSELEACGARR
jgi:chemotaxis protein methyltransferase CheR